PHPTSPLFPYTTLFRSQTRLRMRHATQQAPEERALHRPRPERRVLQRLGLRRLELEQRRGVARSQRIQRRNRVDPKAGHVRGSRSEEHTSELQSLAYLV